MKAISWLEMAFVSKEDGVQLGDGSGLLGSHTNDRYRSVPETKITEILLLGGFAFEASSGEVARALSEIEAALNRWIHIGLGYRLYAGVRWFDPVEVNNFMTWADLSGGDSFWSGRYVQTGRRLVESAAPGGAVTSRVRMRMQRRFDLNQFAVGKQVRLRMPLPIACSAVTEIAVDPIACVGKVIEQRVSDGRIEARLDVPHERAFEMGAQISFVAHRGVAAYDPLDSENIERYLRPVEGLIRVSEKVQALANMLAADTGETFETVRRFWTYMMDQFRGGMVHYDQVSGETGCDWVIERGWFDCQIGSALLVALCRARKIPARIVGGHVLYPLAPTNHFWAEVWVEDRGWTPLDLLSWNLSNGGRDPSWRDHFFMKLDFRMVTQILPKWFTGPMSVHLPNEWQMIQSASDDGITIAFCNLDGALLYEDRIIREMD